MHDGGLRRVIHPDETGTSTARLGQNDWLCGIEAADRQMFVWLAHYRIFRRLQSEWLRNKPNNIGQRRQ